MSNKTNFLKYLSIKNTGLNQTLVIVLIALNAALYVILGLVTAGLPPVYGVRFWPAVVGPAIFAVIFGPLIGGIGAAIGIFISDMMTHGMPLLSLSVGVTSNFIAFFILGYLTRKYNIYRYITAAILSNFVGSGIIAVGVVIWSQFFMLPGATEVSALPLILTVTVFASTFLMQIPFLIIIVPPAVEIIKKALPPSILKSN